LPLIGGNINIHFDPNPIHKQQCSHLTTSPKECTNQCFNNINNFPFQFSISAEKIFTRGNRKLKRKVVADIVEALIDAFLSAGGEMAALLFMDWVGIKVNINITLYERQFNACSDNLVNVSYLESLLKYSFRDRSLLVEAMTHGSYMLPDVPRCYQVLT